MKMQYTKTYRYSKRSTKRKFLAIDAYIKKKTQIKNLTFYIKELKKEQQSKPSKPKVRRTEITKIRSEINEMTNPPAEKSR